MTDKKRTLIVDLDGTIVECGCYYNEANQQTADLMAEQYGVTRELALELIEFLDVWAIKASPTGGFTRERYPRATAAAVAAAGAIATGDLHHHHIYGAFCTANEVFDKPYTPFQGALETLTQYRKAGWQVLILTKGDPDVQQSKLTKNNITTGDQVDAVEIVPRKDAATLQAVMEKYQVDGLSSVYVGDSIRDDMRPANALGLYAVRVATRPQDVWIHEAQEDLVSDRVIATLADLPLAVPLGEFANANLEICDRCDNTYDNHIGNTGCVFPCWTPSGRYRDRLGVN